ncbi:3-oxoacid CoA-transferase [bacterium]|nr:3-oxoacid CoA-transferase [Gemmatimonadota bacterium]MCH2664001.1 3-oxoacid CoA-transferase [bacterium]HCK10099.1 3-oxoacid CoA-transferase [Candidatus Latescibacterota bacterium]
MDYNSHELMICVASRLLEDGATVGVGTGAPCAAAMVAQRTHAPSLFIVFEAGGCGPQLPAMPISVGDSRTYHKAVMATSMIDIFEMCQRGAVDYAFLGGAQIDSHGNLNSTCIGDFESPKVRFPGSGGGNDFASLCWRTLVMTEHDPRRFVESLDFVTSPGFLDGPDARECVGLPADTGPYRVITDLCVMGYSDREKRMEVLSLHPGVSIDDVKSKTGFAVDASSELVETPPPTDQELDVLRHDVDPEKVVIGRE